MKSKKELFEQFQEQSSIFDEKPREQLWNKLEVRLDQKNNVKRLRFYRILAFAAMFTAIVAAVAYFNHYLTDHNPNYYVSNEGFTAYSLEELEDDMSFFNTSSLHQINNFYKNASVQKTFVGKYRSIDDDVILNISIIDFSYVLTLGSGTDQKFMLSSLDNNSLRFESIDAQALELEIDSSDLRITGSDLNPALEDMVFRKLENI